MEPNIVADVARWLPWLSLLAAVVLVGFVLWRLALRNSYKSLGRRPLAIAYLLFVVAIFGSSLLTAESIDRGIFDFFWAILFALPAVTLIGVPTAALLIRNNSLNYGIAAILVVVAVVCVTAFASITDFARQDISETFLDVSAFVVPATAVFFIGLVISIRRQRRLRSGQSSEPAT